MLQMLSELECIIAHGSMCFCDCVFDSFFFLYKIILKIEVCNYHLIIHILLKFRETYLGCLRSLINANGHG